MGDGAFVVQALPLAVARMQEAGLRLRVRSEIIVHDDAFAFVAATGQTTPTLRAWATYQTVHLLPPSTWRDPGPATAAQHLAHELCHLAQWQAFGSADDAEAARLPRFVIEGVCSVVAHEGDKRQPRDEIRERLRDGAVVDFDDDPVFSYGLAHHVFAAVLRCRGQAGLDEVFAAVVAGASVEQALGTSTLRWLDDTCP